MSVLVEIVEERFFLAFLLLLRPSSFTLLLFFLELSGCGFLLGFLVHVGCRVSFREVVSCPLENGGVLDGYAIFVLAAFLLGKVRDIIYATVQAFFLVEPCKVFVLGA